MQCNNGIGVRGNISLIGLPEKGLHLKFSELMNFDNNHVMIDSHTNYMKIPNHVNLHPLQTNQAKQEKLL